MLDITIENIKEQHKAVKNDPIYGRELELLKDALNKYPKNDDISIIAFKISLIDTTNSTNLNRHKSRISIPNLAEVIKNIKDFDKRVENGDESLVEEMIKRTKEKYDINLFSFASKYCCYHNNLIYGKDDYSIYDSIVRKCLPKAICQSMPDKNITSNKIKSWKEACDYKAFNACIGDFLDEMGINVANRRRMFDHFIWWQNRKDSKKDSRIQPKASI